MRSNCTDCIWYDKCKFGERNCDDFYPSCEEADLEISRYEYEENDMERRMAAEEIAAEMNEGDFNVKIGAYPFHRG